MSSSKKQRPDGDGEGGNRQGDSGQGGNGQGGNTQAGSSPGGSGGKGAAKAAAGTTGAKGSATAGQERPAASDGESDTPPAELSARKAAAKAAERGGDEVPPPEEAEGPPQPVASAALIHQSGLDEALLDRLRAYAKEHGIALQEYVAGKSFDEALGEAAEAEHWVVVGEDRILRHAIDAAEARGVGLGLVAVGSRTRVRQFFDLPADIEAQIALAFRQPQLSLDVLRCNDELVLGQAAVGDVPFLDRRGQALIHAQDTLTRRWAVAASLFWTALKRLFVITPSVVRLHIGKEEKPRRTAVVGIVLLENDVEHVAGRMVGEELSARDGRVTALLLAPTSVVSYLAFLLRSALGGWTPGGRLPRALSYVKTSGLRITSDVALDVRVDGIRHRDKNITITVNPQALRLNAGPRFDGMAGVEDNGKDTLKLLNLPENESRLAMIRKRLPLFTHALEDDFKDLFLLLKDSARIGPDYVTLMILSSLIGAFGLLLNSAAVIIGAMVLAPLMAPIICLSMAALRRDAALMRASGFAIFVGVSLVLAVAAVVALMVPMRLQTPEITARLAPNLLDLGIAVFSGVAGAYAHARENIMKSLPGVAIAVALVPPLAVAGVGLGWWNLDVFGGAMLLFATNLVGITLAGAVTFMVLGYGPVKRTTRGLLLPLVAAALIAVPLAWSFERMHSTWQAERTVAERVFEVAGERLQLARPRVSFESGVAHVHADVYADAPVTAVHLQGLRTALSQLLEREVMLDVSLRLRVQAGADG